DPQRRAQPRLADRRLPPLTRAGRGVRPSRPRRPRAAPASRRGAPDRRQRHRLLHGRRRRRRGGAGAAGPEARGVAGARRGARHRGSRSRRARRGGRCRAGPARPGRGPGGDAVEGARRRRRRGLRRRRCPAAPPAARAGADLLDGAPPSHRGRGARGAPRAARRRRGVAATVARQRTSPARGARRARRRDHAHRPGHRRRGGARGGAGAGAARHRPPGAGGAPAHRARGHQPLAPGRRGGAGAHRDGVAVSRLLFVTGTDTGAGKTVVAAAVVAALRGRGLRVAGLKPVATGVELGQAGEDATLLARASELDPHECLLASYTLPRSPLAAARAEQRSLDVGALAASIRLRAVGLVLLVVEGVGGLLVPLSDTATVRDLARLLDAPVLIAARAGLGTIGHSALTVESARLAGLDVCGVVLSDVDGSAGADFARENAEQIATQCGVRVLGIVPHLADTEEAAAHVDVDALLQWSDAAARHEEVVALDRRHVWHPFTQTSEWRDEDPVVIRAARGCRLVDDRGREYVDGVASLWANVHGHAHPRLDAALREQAGRVAHSTFLGLTHEPGARLAAELSAIAPAGLTRVFYSEAGAAAVEVGLRVALLAQRHCGQPQRTRFVSLTESYHGDTAGAVSVGRSEPFHRGLDPLLFDVLRVPPPHLVGEEASTRALHDTLQEHGEQIAALVVEPRMQGAAGMWPHSDEWLRQAAHAARSAGALVLCDEVATGFGRTGDMFASGGAGLAPDILTVGKGLTGGYLPLSATLATEELFELFTSPYTEHRAL